jgi:GNAT superfamily N-acetyltransferase
MSGLGPGAEEKLRRRIEASPYAETLAQMYCVVAVEASELVGMGALDGSQIKRMYVRPDRRRRGIGSLILDLLEAEAADRNLPRLELDAPPGSAGFYEKMGYRRLSERRWALDGAEIHNVVMAKELQQGRT